MECRSCKSRTARHRCGKCLVTPYCSAACQKADWKSNHAQICGSLLVLIEGGTKREREEEEEDCDVDVITQEPVPEFHFEVMVGTKKYCFDIPALAYWIVTSGQHAFPIDQIAQYTTIDMDSVRRPKNPATMLPFTDEELLAFAAKLEEYWVLNPGERPKGGNTVFTIQLSSETFDEVGGDETTWNVAGDGWNGLTANLTARDVQENGLLPLIVHLEDVIIRDRNANDLNVSEITVSFTLDQETYGENPLYFNSFEKNYSDFQEFLEAALWQRAETKDEEVTYIDDIDDLQTKLLNGTIKNATLSVSYAITPPKFVLKTIFPDGSGSIDGVYPYDYDKLDSVKDAYLKIIPNPVQNGYSPNIMVKWIVKFESGLKKTFDYADKQVIQHVEDNSFDLDINVNQIENFIDDDDIARITLIIKLQPPLQ